jgi:nucleotidyltransferase/DNA polymerase involved in DNA repair
VAVAHSKAAGSSDVSSCNYAARHRGVRNGLSPPSAALHSSGPDGHRHVHVQGQGALSGAGCLPIRLQAVRDRL